MRRWISLSVAGLLCLAGSSAAHAAPWWYLGDFSKFGCDRIAMRDLVAQAVVSSGLSSSPFKEPSGQWVSANNGDTNVVVTINPLSATNFWLDVFSTSNTSQSNALAWRDSVRTHIQNITFIDCGPVTVGVNE